MIKTIQSRKYKLSVNEYLGGRIESFASLKNDKWIDIFRPKPTENFEQDGIPLFGSFSMNPFCNRLKPSEILTSDGQIKVHSNWSEQGCAIHGLGLNEVWEKSNESKNNLKLIHELHALEGQAVGIGMQDIMVSDEKGLIVRIGYCNNKFDWIKAGLGFHPWYYLDEGEATLEFQAEGAFLVDEDYFPTDTVKQKDSNIQLSSQSNNGIDQCFWGWSGKASLALEATNTKVVIQSNATNLHVYINKSLHSICIEPVSHVTNAMHDSRWNKIAGMDTIKRGETKWLQMSVKTH